MARQKKIKPIKFFHPIPGIVETNPIIEAKKLKRSWIEENGRDLLKFKQELKKCPISELREKITSVGFISRCPGIRQFMNRGYIIPNPIDFYIETDGDGQKICATTMTPPNFGDFFKIKYHGEQQLNAYTAVPLNSNKTIIKVCTGWNVIPHEDYVFIITSPHYNNEPRFTSAVGVLDPAYDTQVNIFLFWHVKEGRELIKAGTPLAQYIPVPRDLIQPPLECEFLKKEYHEHFMAAQNSIHNYLHDEGRDTETLKDIAFKIFKKFY